MTALPESKLRLAYLLSRYPAVSHTFFLNEVLGLRALGLAVETASINPPDRPRARLSERERTEAENTFYLKGGKKLKALAALCGIATRHPAVLCRGLCAVGRVPALPLKTRLFWLAYLAEALLLGDWMRRRALPHLHVHFGGAVATVGMLTAQAWRIPYSLTIHGPEELQNMASYHLRQKVAQASFVVCISDFCRSQLQQITPPAEWDKFTVIRLGVADELLQQPARQGDAEGSEHRPATLLCVGRLVPEKGQRLLLQAVARLRTRGIHTRLTLVGDGVDRSTLEAETDVLGLQSAVEFTGSLAHDAALERCASCDVFALPSFAEGIPVALMEAMALGIACVSTTIAGIPELILSRENGLLVAPSSLDALTDALALLAVDPALRQRLGQAARAEVARRYRLAHNLQELQSLFQQRCTAPVDKRP